MTHSELVEFGAVWLRRTDHGYTMPFVRKELVTGAGEVPDVFGFGSGHSVLIECKTSRADFNADAKKYWRRHPEFGLGNYRFFLCAKGLLLDDELPEHWGLLYASDTGKFAMEKEPTRQPFSVKGERDFMYSVIRREVSVRLK